MSDEFMLGTTPYTKDELDATISTKLTSLATADRHVIEEGVMNPYLYFAATEELRDDVDVHKQNRRSQYTVDNIWKNTDVTAGVHAFFPKAEIRLILLSYIQRWNVIPFNQHTTKGDLQIYKNELLIFKQTLEVCLSSERICFIIWSTAASYNSVNQNDFSSVVVAYLHRLLLQSWLTNRPDKTTKDDFETILKKTLTSLKTKKFVDYKNVPHSLNASVSGVVENLCGFTKKLSVCGISSFIDLGNLHYKRDDENYTTIRSCFNIPLDCITTPETYLKDWFLQTFSVAPFMFFIQPNKQFNDLKSIDMPLISQNSMLSITYKQIGFVSAGNDNPYFYVYELAAKE